jgi:hypothetical protein
MHDKYSLLEQCGVSKGLENYSARPGLLSSTLRFVSALDGALSKKRITVCESLSFVVERATVEGPALLTNLDQLYLVGA